MQIERPVWKESHSSAQLASFLYSNYVYFSFALSYLFSSIHISLFHTGQSKISLLKFRREPATIRALMLG